MSLQAALSGSVSAVTANSNSIAAISDNISNLNTVGYKASDISFTTLITGSSLGVGGGTLAANRPLISQQGLIQATGISTDIAIQGQGFLVVTDEITNGETRYTRAGSFRQDNQGNFVNTAGFYLQGWPIDSEGRLPGATGNLNTTPSALLESLEIVNTVDISGVAFATTNIDIAANLDASEPALLGSGETIDFELTGSSGANDDIASNDIIFPDNNVIANDQLLVQIDGTTVGTFTYGAFDQSADVTTGNTVDVASTGASLIGFDPASAAGPLVASEQFDVTIDGTTYTLQLVASGATPNVISATNVITFTSLDDLATAMDTIPGISARTDAGEGQLIFGADDPANDAVTIAENGTTIAADLGLATVGTAADTFNSLDNLSDLVNAIDGLTATVTNSQFNASLDINATSALAQITFDDNVIGGGAADDMMELLGITVPATALGPLYVPASSTSNMAGGAISADFSRSIQVFDSLGTGHSLFTSFVKLANNTWAVEVFASDPSELVGATSDGLLASGTITFNGDGSLRSVDTSLTSGFTANWSNGAETSTITLDLGTAGPPVGTAGATVFGLTDGLSQFDGPFRTQLVEQNGASAGLLSDIEITTDGFVLANFSNGESREVYRLPLASFANPDGLRQINGNAFVQTDASGTFTLNTTEDSGVGEYVTGAVEGANSELSQELTEVIVAQRNYEAATQIISTVDELLENLINVLR